MTHCDGDFPASDGMGGYWAEVWTSEVLVKICFVELEGYHVFDIILTLFPVSEDEENIPVPQIPTNAGLILICPS